jgi:integrase
VLAGIRNRHAAPPRQKEAVLPEDVIAMLKTLDRGTLRDLRDRAMLSIGLAGGLRRPEIVGPDVDRDDTTDRRGWVEILDRGLIVGAPQGLYAKPRFRGQTMNVGHAAGRRRAPGSLSGR